MKNGGEMDEQQAVRRLKQGDIGGLEALVHLHQVRAMRAAYLVTHDRAQAEDVVQTAFIRAYERIHQFDSQRPFAPWFLRSVVNDAVKAVSRSQRFIELDNDDFSWEETLPDTELSPDDSVEAEEVRQTMWDALAKLPAQQRAAVVMRYYLGLSEAEMSQELTSPPGTIKWRLHTARERLRKLLTLTDLYLERRPE
jgi:RNA polymerase sigma-70 factor (ECF subfamily)